MSSAAVCMHHSILEHVNGCPVHCLLTLRAIPDILCPAILYTQRVDSCKSHIPGSCDYWFPDGFIQWKTLSKDHGQVRSCRLYSLRHSAVVTLWVTAYSPVFYSFNTFTTISLYYIPLLGLPGLDSVFMSGI